MTKSCTDANNIYDNVPHCQGEINLPGTRDHAYFTRKSNIIKWPKLPLNGASSLDKAAVYDGDFTLAADAKFYKIDLVPSEQEPKSEQVGSYGSYHFTNTVSLVLPGTGEKVTGLVSELSNDKVVFIVPQTDGKCRVFGDEAFNTSVKPSQSIGKGSSDPNNTTIEISCESMASMPFYAGTIVTDDGNISGLTDELIVTPSPGT